jgi:viroplasmin and RNaseH domain-containing protein
LLFNIEKIKLLYANEKNDFFIIDNKCSVENLQYLLDVYGFSRFKCYSLIDETPEVLINFFMLRNKYCEKYEIINNYVHKIEYNTNYTNRHDVINYISNPEDKYLEIGVETGYTFNNVHFTNKTGVDPSPAFESDDLVIKTSDGFFENLHLWNSKKM